MARPCGHTIQLEPGHPYEKGACRICWLYWNDSAYKALWDAAPPVLPTPTPEHIKKQIEERKNGGCGCGKKS
jgi:hypothetical protein